MGKTTFFATDLIPALQDLGTIVICVDLWSQPQANPAELVHGAIRKSLNALQTPSTGMLQELILKLKLVSSFQTGAAGFKFGFKLADVSKEGGVSLAQAFTELIDQAKTDLVLIIDEVRHAFGSAV